MSAEVDIFYCENGQQISITIPKIVYKHYAQLSIANINQCLFSNDIDCHH